MVILVSYTVFNLLYGGKPFLAHPLRVFYLVIYVTYIATNLTIAVKLLKPVVNDVGLWITEQFYRLAAFVSPPY